MAVVATEVDPVAISDKTTVAEAPPESVMVTFCFVKSIPLSFIILSPTSTPLAVASKIMLPAPVSSVSNNILSLASEPSESVLSKRRVFPKSSFATLDPSSDPFESVPLSNKN